MAQIEQCRKVKRAVVMLEYEDGAQGDVFDLAALTTEMAMAPNADRHQHGLIELHVRAGPDYSQNSQNGSWPLKVEVSWVAMAAFDRSGRSGHLDDAVNSSMPDSLTKSR